MKLDASREFEMLAKVAGNITTTATMVGDDEVIIDLVGALANTINLVFDTLKKTNDAHSVLMREQADKALHDQGFQRKVED